MIPVVVGSSPISHPNIHADSSQEGCESIQREIPTMGIQTVLQYLLNLRPALPMSREKPCSSASNGEVRRWIADGPILLNGERWTHDEPMPPLVWSLVFFPKSPKNRTTLL